MLLEEASSTSRATLTAVRQNGKNSHWLLKHDIHFAFDAAIPKTC